MMKCFGAVVAVLDERNSARFNGRPCTWETKRPRKAGLPFILFIGLDGSGKTTCIQTLKHGTRKLQPALSQRRDKRGIKQQTVISNPQGSEESLSQEAQVQRLPFATPRSEHASLSHIRSLSKEFVAIDPPGAAAYRSGWKDLMQYAEAVVLVVSCTDAVRFPIARELLWNLLPRMSGRNAPCLVLASKRDEVQMSDTSAPSAQERGSALKQREQGAGAQDEAGSGGPLDPEDLIFDLELAPLLSSLAAPWALRAVCSHSEEEVCEGMEWLLARVHAIRRLRRKEDQGASALEGFQGANAEYSANFVAARALQQQAELMRQEQRAGQLHAEQLMKRAHALLHGDL